ncbi:hypothetical protein [Vibrio alginolyticus]|uniref:hypothetical protein n=1 Tax=Vibrio alginolyticus TaxID=663 RepID=UPI003D7C580F
MVSITESGVIFGNFAPDNCYQIEHSQGHSSLGQGFKMVEFTFLTDQKLYVIEAKSSIPNPQTDLSKYDEFWNEIFEKFENALLLQMMGYVRRNEHSANELPQNLKTMNWEQISIQLRLVIPKVPDGEALNQITLKFRQRMLKLKKLWNINDAHIFVLNEGKARREGLLV